MPPSDCRWFSVRYSSLTGRGVLRIKPQRPTTWRVGSLHKLILLITLLLIPTMPPGERAPSAVTSATAHNELMQQALPTARGVLSSASSMALILRCTGSLFTTYAGNCLIHGSAV